MSKHGQQALQNALKMPPEPAAKAAPVEIAHAYALQRLPDGRFVALHLEGVTARKVERLAPNGASESAPLATARCGNAMDKRTRFRMWGGS